jgi:uncharacterized membrane protein ArfC
MSHVHGWLFALSFALGFVLTFALLSVARRAPGPAAGKPEPSTTRIVADPPTTKVAADPPTTRISVDPPTTKIQARQEFPTTKIPVSPLAPYGPGSANPGPGGAGPPGWLVKGRMDTKLFYTPDDPTYDVTVAQVWFIDEESAARAGYTPWRER